MGYYQICFLVPLYWLAMSVASLTAAYQLFIKPYYWEKTVHGLHFKKDLPGKEQKIYEPAGLPKAPKKEWSFALDRKLAQDRILASDKKRVLIFNWRDMRHKLAGGAEIYAQEIAKCWVKKGNLVTIFSGNDGTSLREEIIDGVDIIRRADFMACIFGLLFIIFCALGENMI